jgi:DNA-binding NtrC family response regulator
MDVNHRGFRILVVDDEAAMREILAQRLEGWGYEVLLAADAETAGELAEGEDPQLVISDVVLPKTTGIQLLPRLKAGRPDRPVILITAHGSIDDAVEAMKRGAHDFLTKPLDYESLRATLEEVRGRIEAGRSTRDLQAALASSPGPGGLVGTSESIRSVFAMIDTVASSDATVLLVGETGTGKELAARAIHDLSQRQNGPFVALNAAAIPESLIESELFGHEKGAFTGADRTHTGCFERADGGTLFLDEIAEMPIDVQPKLLRVLEQAAVRRVGGSRDVPFSVRLVAATNRDPQAAVADGRLREDLFYRINVFPIRLPPLRERKEDIPLLAQHFLELFNQKHSMSVVGFSEAARDRLLAHEWTGNVRELRNVIERATILARQGWLEETHLPPLVRLSRAVPADGLVLPADTTVEEAERLLILETLHRVGDNKAEAARRLGVDVKTIRNKLKRYGIDEAVT